MSILDVGIDSANNVSAAQAMVIRRAVQRPSMRFVPAKNQEQQSRQLVHRARHGFVESRTAAINRIRGLPRKFSLVLPLHVEVVRCEARNESALQNLCVPYRSWFSA